MKYLIIAFIVLMFTPIQGQDAALPFREIPQYPDTYSPGNVMGRLIDGLGFRYFWATEGLRTEDLKFRPSEEGRSLEETIDHIYGLSLTIVNSPQSKVNESSDWSHLGFEEKRRETLVNFQKASELFKSGKPGDMDGYRVIFKRDENISEYPFWNMINGPIADALHHTGQIVTLRRSSGNPINPKVSVFNGRLRE